MLKLKDETVSEVHQICSSMPMTLGEGLGDVILALDSMQVLAHMLAHMLKAISTCCRHITGRIILRIGIFVTSH